MWKPPRNPSPDACTEAQIERHYDICDDQVMRDDALCNAFERDPANAACLACIFTTEDQDAYGAVVILRNGQNQINASGCIALVDGNLTANGCAAKHQATFQCWEAACLDQCSSNDAMMACQAAASSSVCKTYVNNEECSASPAFAICGGYASYKEYFLAYGRMFCSTGLSDGGMGYAGGG
jgi:hypothetical protein